MQVSHGDKPPVRDVPLVTRNGWNDAGMKGYRMLHGMGD